MKLILCSVIVGLLLLNLASATPSCEVAADNTDAILEMYYAIVEGADSPVSGEELTINYTKYVNYNNKKEYLPVPGADVYVAGYDKYGELNGFLVYATTDQKGLYRFTPPLEGDYMVQVGNTSPVKVEVKKNQVKNSGMITGGVVAAEAEDVLVLDEPEPPVVDAPADHGSLLDLVVNGTKSECADTQVPNLVMMLVGLLIS